MTDNLFYLLEKTLKRLDLNQNQLPTSLDTWKEFLDRINRGFNDFEQERYLLERSMEISSREMIELNEKFEQAQATARIGLWIYDRLEDKIFWSRETYRLFGISPTSSPPRFNEAMLLVHEDERENLLKLIDRAFENDQEYEYEFRIKNLKDNNYYWVYTKGNVMYKSTLENKKTNRYLSGIIMDVTERKQAETQLAELQQKLVISARQAGMSEIATSVLHNIGNILNSVNVSMAMINEILDEVRPDNLVQATQLLKQNIPSNIDYFINDPKGKILIHYFDEYSKQLLEDIRKIKSESEGLDANIKHIKSVVNMQKEISGVYEVEEKVNVSHAINTAIKIGCPNPELNKIAIVKDFPKSLDVVIDKAKLLQILINLIKNARESILISTNPDKHIRIEASKIEGDKHFVITISDNGVGVEKHLLTKIFSLGFTTKPDGHGFGLHSSANAATELGGQLLVESEGADKGAIFILKLPCEAVKERKNGKSTATNINY